MNRKYRICLEVILIVLCGMAAWFLPSGSEQTVLEIQKALIGFAGLVVTIFGIWIAVIFPVLSGLLADGKVKREVTQLVRYDALVRSLYRSCFTLTACFFVFLVLSFISDFSPWVARFSALFSWLAFVSTAWALWSAIWSGEGAVVGGINESVRKGVVRRFRAMGKSVNKKPA